MLNDLLLLCGSFCTQHSGVEVVHLGFKRIYFNGLRSCVGGDHLCCLRHNSCMLLSKRVGSIKSSIECLDLSLRSCCRSGLSETSVLCINNSLRLLLNDLLLLCGSFCSQKGIVEVGDLVFKFSYFNGLRSNIGGDHLSCLRHNNGLLLFGSVCSRESGIECINLGLRICNSLGLGQAFLLCINNGLCLLLEDFFLLCGSFCAHHSRVEVVHFGVELSYLCGCSIRLSGGNHCLLFGIDYGIFCCGSGSSVISGVESSNLC